MALTPAPAEPVGESAERSWPCTRCGARNPLADNICGGCGSGFLAEVAEGQAPLLRLPLVGDLTRFSRPQRFLLAGGAVVLLLVPVAALSFVLTSGPTNTDPLPPPSSELQTAQPVAPVVPTSPDLPPAVDPAAPLAPTSPDLPTPVASP